MADPYAAYEISRVVDYNPDTGPSYVLTFAGTLTEMGVIAAYYQQLGAGAPIGYGYKTNLVRTAQDGAVLVVRIPDQILYITRWDFETTPRPVPIWWINAIREYIKNDAGDVLYPVLNGGDGTLEQLDTDRGWLRRVGYLQNAVQLMKSGQDPTAVLSGLGVTLNYTDWNIIYLMIREGEYVDWKQPVLKRQRTVPVGLFDTRTRVSGVPQLYTLNGIYNLFGMSNDIYDQAVEVYTGLPTAPPNTMWAWKQMRDDSNTIIGSGKVQECKDWVFGRWSTITHTLVA